MYREPDRQLSTTSQSIIVDRLLAALPHVSARPRVEHEPHALPHQPAVAHQSIPRSVPRWRPLTQVGRARSTYEYDTFGSWARVALGITLGIAITFWPYSMCGIGLAGYFCGTLVVMAAAVWSAINAWGNRAAFAHVMSIGLFLWGIALAGDQLLQRTGYAYAQLAWGCG